MLGQIINKIATLTTGKNFPTLERPSHVDMKNTNTNEYHMALQYDHLAHNNFWLPIAIKEGKGSYIWDVTGKKYIDFMSAYSCVNQGHCHPKILEVFIEQAKKLTITSFVTTNDKVGPAAKRLTELLGYDKILFMNVGSEAVDCACLIARKWAYKVKKVPDGKAAILFPKMGYWGMTIGARAACDEKARREGFEPFASENLRFDFVEFNDLDSLETKLKGDPNIAAFVVEPVEGHAGNIHPKPGYLKGVKQLCEKYNVLMVCDEVQAGLGRCGKLFCHQWDDIRPDIVTLGKSLSGGFMPVSAVLADNNIMNVLSPDEYQSTYAANPLACAVAQKAVEVLFEENMIEHCEKMGKIVEEELKSYHYSFVTDIQCGRGLFASIQISEELGCWTICQMMLENGVLVKPDLGNRIKIMPPIIISEEDLKHGLKIIKDALDAYDKKGKLNLLA